MRRRDQRLSDDSLVSKMEALLGSDSLEEPGLKSQKVGDFHRALLCIMHGEPTAQEPSIPYGNNQNPSWKGVIGDSIVTAYPGNGANRTREMNDGSRPYLEVGAGGEKRNVISPFDMMRRDRPYRVLHVQPISPPHADRVFVTASTDIDSGRSGFYAAVSTLDGHEPIQLKNLGRITGVESPVVIPEGSSIASMISADPDGHVLFATDMDLRVIDSDGKQCTQLRYAKKWKQAPVYARFITSLGEFLTVHTGTESDPVTIVRRFKIKEDSLETLQVWALEDAEYNGVRATAVGIQAPQVLDLGFGRIALLRKVNVDRSQSSGKEVVILKAKVEMPIGRFLMNEPSNEVFSAFGPEKEWATVVQRRSDVVRWIDLYGNK